MESGEKTQYDYNGLKMRLKNIQTLKGRSGGYHSYAGQEGQGTQTVPFRTRETQYVMDFLSDVNRDLMMYEKEDS